MPRIVLAGGGTGGHLMPALALAEAIRAIRSDVEPVLVGAIRGVEAQLLPTRPYRYHLLPAEPLYRGRWWRNVRWPFLLPRLWHACRDVLEIERPALVVGTGGYAAGPVLLAARRRGVPLALQEQNAAPGITTRWAARWARQVHLGFPEAASRLHVGPATEILSLGNPIPPPNQAGRAAARTTLDIAPDVPVLLVTGGSQGARAINAAVAGALTRGLLDGVTVLWSTGRSTHADFAALHRPPQIQVRPFWDPIAAAYGAADLVVSRAGAMTIAEETAWGLPAVLVPLPTAAGDHQTANAAALEQAGAAVHLPESQATPESLASAVRSILESPHRRTAMAEAAKKRGHPDAAQAIARRLLDLL
jgi:UDP-N-acetylglucosamine--N-acetylmuramyl-(pentapeptide) pyrophosphoryl-undecaprenol N-acetylglucosamine transferase